MRSSLLAQTIRAHHAIRRPMLIEGQPGCGKTSIPRQVAAEMGIGYIEINVPEIPMEDYGMPVINDARDGIRYVVPGEDFPFVGSEFPEEGFLVADELSGGNTDVQKIWSRITQTRELRGRSLMPGWTIISTGNRTQDKAGANRILSMLANRMTRYTMEPHLDDWCNWALDKGGVDPIVVAFVRFKPALLSNFDPQQDSNPTPRSWAEGVSPLLGVLPAEAEFESFKGSVGEGAAAEFTAFLRMYRELPNPDAVIMDPENAAVPTRMDVLFATSAAVASRASSGNFERVMTYLKRLPPEFMVLGVRDSIRADRSVTQSAAFTHWASHEGKDVLL